MAALTDGAPLPQGFSDDKKFFTDAWSTSILWTTAIREVLCHEQSAFQEVVVVDTVELGRMLVLDGNLQCAEKDEAAYHELIVHPALCRRAARPQNLRVLIIGGGDGGAAREALRHPGVVHVDLVDIDAKVMEVSKTYLHQVWRKPDGSGPLDDDARLTLRAEDGVAFLEDIAERNVDDEKYDLVVVDASDPVGPGTVLYSDRFYGAIAKCLRDDGAVTVQSGSWFYLPEVLQTVFHGLGRHFANVRAYECFSAIYPGGIWNLCMATKDDADMREVDHARVDALQQVGEGCAWYDAGIHAAAFALPPNAKKVLQQAPPSLEELSNAVQGMMDR